MEQGYHRVVSEFLLPELSTIVLSYLRITLRPLLTEDGKEVPKIGEDAKKPNRILFSKEGDIIAVYPITEGFRVITYGLEGAIKRRWSHKENKISPRGVAELPNGDLVISDYHYERILIFDRDGHLLKQWCGNGPQENRVDRPMGVAILPNDVIAVHTHCSWRITMFTREGEFLQQHVLIPNTYAYSPTGIIPSGSGGFVTITPLEKGGCVRMFDGKGELIRRWGEFGPREGELKGPSDVAILPHGEIIIDDSCNDRIQAYTSDGKYLCQWDHKFPSTSFAAKGNMIAVATHDGPPYIQILCLCLDIASPVPEPLPSVMLHGERE